MGRWKGTLCPWKADCSKKWVAGMGPPSLESGLPVKNGPLERCPPSLEGALRRWKADCLIKMGRWKATPFGVLKIYMRVGVLCAPAAARGPGHHSSIVCWSVSHTECVLSELLLTPYMGSCICSLIRGRVSIGRGLCLPPA